MIMLDVNNLHISTKNHSGNGLDERFLLALVLCDKEIFQYKAVRMIIDYMWRQHYPVFVRKLLLPYIIYLILFIITTEVEFHRFTI
jgi:hypothetical protein